MLFYGGQNLISFVCQEYMFEAELWYNKLNCLTHLMHLGRCQSRQNLLYSALCRCLCSQKRHYAYLALQSTANLLLVIKCKNLHILVYIFLFLLTPARLKSAFCWPNPVFQYPSLVRVACLLPCLWHPAPMAHAPSATSPQFVCLVHYVPVLIKSYYWGINPNNAGINCYYPIFGVNILTENNTE